MKCLELVDTALGSIVIPKQWVDELVAEFEKYQDGAGQKLKNEFALLRERLGKVEVQEDQVFELLSEGTITEEEPKKPFDLLAVRGRSENWRSLVPRLRTEILTCHALCSSL